MSKENHYIQLSIQPKNKHGIKEFISSINYKFRDNNDVHKFSFGYIRLTKRSCAHRELNLHIVPKQ